MMFKELILVRSFGFSLGEQSHFDKSDFNVLYAS